MNWRPALLDTKEMFVDSGSHHIRHGSEALRMRTVCGAKNIMQLVMSQSRFAFHTHPHSEFSIIDAGNGYPCRRTEIQEYNAVDS